MFALSLILHILAATVWTGGHVLLVFIFLIPGLKKKDLSEMLKFEEKYERIGMPALVILVITGIYQAYFYLPDFSQWFDFSQHISQHISLKIFFLVAIVLLAIDVKFRLFKKDELPMWSFALHVLGVTILSLLLVIAGVSFQHNVL